MKALSENLKRLRESRNISKSELGRLLNIAPSAYSVYETGLKNVGDREPTLTNLVKLADFFNVSIDELLNHSVDEMEYYSEMWKSAGFEVYTENEKVILDQLALKPIEEVIKKNKTGGLTFDLISGSNGRMIFDSKTDFFEYSRNAQFLFQQEIKKEFKNFGRMLFWDTTSKLAYIRSQKLISTGDYSEEKLNAGDYQYSELKNANAQ